MRRTAQDTCATAHLNVPPYTPTRGAATMHKTYTVNEVAGKTPGTYVFSPAKLTIKVGDTVTFVDKSLPVPHDVIGTNNKVINRAAINTATYKLTFTKAGVYKYNCTIHLPSMVGQITVTK